MPETKTVLLFLVTALAEIVGCYLPSLWLSHGKSAWLLVPGALSLAAFAWLLSLHPTASGRVYAAYGGVYIFVAIVWLWAVDGVRPTPWDIAGAALALAGMGVIMFAPEAPEQSITDRRRVRHHCSQTRDNHCPPSPLAHWPIGPTLWNPLMTCSSPSTRILIKAVLASAAVALAGLAQAQAVFKITAIPDESPTELARKAAPLVKYLEHKLGTKVEFTPVSDYAAAVEALANKQVDMAWYGGFTFVQASIRSGGKVVPLVQREEDEKFRSVFISADPAIRALADLKGKTVSFGSQSSTSGHLMPRSYLLQAQIDPDKDFKRVAYSGAHDATIAAVASGKVDAGALNISVWEKFVADKKVDTGKVKVIFTTPAYFDYNWTVHSDMPVAQREKLTKAFLDLNRNTPEGKEILDLQRATRFIPTQASNYKGIETAARSAGLIK